MYETYERTPKTKSKPKVQRAILADILLEADGPLSFSQIVNKARGAHYEDTFKRGPQVVTIEESISYNLDKMVEEGSAKKSLSKA